MGGVLSADTECITTAFALTLFDRKFLTYRWYRCDTHPDSGAAVDCRRIEGSGSYGSTYRIRDDDIGKRIYSQVSFVTNQGLSRHTRRSDPTAPITP